MKLIALFGLLVGFSLSEVTKDESVYVLTDSNFDEFLKENPTVLVEFYAPWYF
jgi:hypothetical protein